MRVCVRSFGGPSFGRYTFSSRPRRIFLNSRTSRPSWPLFHSVYLFFLNRIFFHLQVIHFCFLVFFCVLVERFAWVCFESFRVSVFSKLGLCVAVRSFVLFLMCDFFKCNLRFTFLYCTNTKADWMDGWLLGCGCVSCCNKAKDCSHIHDDDNVGAACAHSFGQGKEEQQLGIHFKSLKYSLVVNDVTAARDRWCGQRRVGGIVAHK